MSVASRLRALGADTTPLKESRDFRLLFIAGTVFYFGAMVSGVAVPFQIYALTGSTFNVGLVGLFALVPLVFGWIAARHESSEVGSSTNVVVIPNFGSVYFSRLNVPP